MYYKCKHLDCRNTRKYETWIGVIKARACRLVCLSRMVEGGGVYGGPVPAKAGN